MVMAMIYEFYQVCETMGKIQRELPVKINTVLYDPRFTNESIIDEVRSGTDPGAIDVPNYYDEVFADLDHTLKHFNCFTYVCSSDDIDEEIKYGDFDYYAGMVTSRIGVIYMRSSHPWALPSRALLYGPSIQVFVSNDDQFIELCPTNQDIYKKIMIQSEPVRTYHVKEFLKSSNRPLLDPEFK